MPSSGSDTTWRQWYLAGLTTLTAWSTAVGWQAQVVSYPLYRAVGAEEFPAYHLQYDRSIPAVVIAPGFVSFAAAMGLPWARPPEVPRPVAALVSVAGALSLASTVLRAVPMHDRLDEIGQDEATITRLLRANLLRTAALTTATVALTWCAGRTRGG